MPEITFRHLECALAMLIIMVAVAMGAPPFTCPLHTAIKFGNPDGGHVRTFGNSKFVLSYDGSKRTARWVAEYLPPGKPAHKEPRHNVFRPDPSVPREFRSMLSDYFLSNYDRGHLAPAADHAYARDAMDATFLLSNMVPQDKTLNRGLWADLEAWCRDQARSANGTWVFTGPAFMPADAPAQDIRKPDLAVTYRVIGPNHVAVPTHLWKTILIQGVNAPAVRSFLVPNAAPPDGKRFIDYAVDTDFLEHWVGLDFWSELPDDVETALEGDYP